MFNGVTGSIRVTVVAAPTVTAVSISGAGGQVTAGGAATLTAIATYSDGTTANVTLSATWSSSNTAVATVSNSGEAAFLTVGDVDLRAEFSGVTGSIRVTVIAVAVISTVTGVVTDSVNGAPLSGVSVQVVGGPNDGRATQTNGSGTYTLTNLEHGLLVVRFSANAYTSATRELDLSQDAQLNASLIPNFSIFYGTFNIAMTIIQQTCESPVILPPTGTLRLVGGTTGTGVEAHVTERGITRIYEGGIINSNGEFSAVLPPGTLLPGFVDRGLQPKHDVGGTITGTVSGNTISGVEMMVYGIPCVGKIINVAFTGSK
jgi:hypothetical protein